MSFKDFLMNLFNNNEKIEEEPIQELDTLIIPTNEITDSIFVNFMTSHPFIDTSKINIIYDNSEGTDYFTYITKTNIPDEINNDWVSKDISEEGEKNHYFYRLEQYKTLNKKR